MHLARSGLRLPITLGFVLVILLPLIVVYAGANRSSVVAVHLRDHVLPQIALFDMANDLEDGFQVISLTLRNIALSRDMATKQQEKARFDQARVKIAEDLDHLERMVESAQNREILTRIKEKWSAVETLLDKALAHGMANKHLEAGEVVLAEMGPDQANLFKETHLLVKNQIKGARERNEAVLEKVYNIRFFLFLLGGVALILGALIANATISETKQAEKVLQESEQKYRNIFENAVEGMFQTTPEGRLLNANPALAEMFGFASAQEMLNRITDISRSYVDVGRRQIFKKILEEQGVIREFEIQFYRRDGEKFWVSVNARAVKDENGAILYYEGFNINITARKQAEERLEAERQRLYALLDGLPGFVSLRAPDYSVPYANRYFMEMFSDPKGRVCYEVKFQRQEPCEYCPMFKVFESNGPQEFEWAGPNGKTYQVYQYPFADIDGSPLVIELGIDISARKQAEAAFKDLILSAPIGIYILQDGKCILVNPGFEKITGYREEELLGKRALSLVVPEFAEHVRKNAIRMLKGETSQPYEYQTITKDGEAKWIMETITRTKYLGKRATLGYFMDITGLKKLETQLFQAQKMEAVARLAGGVAHDFNNLLMAVMCLGDMIKEELPSDNRLHQYGDGITKSARQAISLTRQLLAFSRKQVLHPEVINLNKIVTDMEKLLGQFIGEDINLATVLGPNLGMVKADPGQIEQVIMNLVVNARDAMPNGGKLLIETSNKEVDETLAARYGDIVPGNYVVLSVNDSGVGMDKETLTHIFEPFFTTKEADKGTGLGLATVYGIVRQSGGQIEVYSEPGLGTTFYILLPQVKRTLVKTEAEEAPTEPVGGHETILVVEDENILRALICSSLQGYGYQVLEARDGAEALELAGQHEGLIHLMLTDVVMPQMRGTELAEKMAALRPNTKVLYMSGYVEDAARMQEMLAAGGAFLQKPFGTKTLLDKVRLVLSGSGE